MSDLVLSLAAATRFSASSARPDSLRSSSESLVRSSDTAIFNLLLLTARRMSDGRVSEHHPFLVIFRASPGSSSQR